MELEKLKTYVTVS